MPSALRPTAVFTTDRSVLESEEAMSKALFSFAIASSTESEARIEVSLRLFLSVSVPTGTCVDKIKSEESLMLSPIA